MFRVTLGFWEIGAGDGIRTRDINLGKVALYQLSYSRVWQADVFYSLAQAAQSQFEAAELGV